MTLTVIEINDYQLTLTQQDNSYHQLGYALVTDDRVIFGDDAYQQAKTSPTQVYCHYWQRLGFEKISSANNQVRHFADLAYLQLQNLLSQALPSTQVCLLVPSSYTQQQLSLLLGIAQSCQLEVIALVNAPLLRLADCRERGEYALFDIGLHHCDHSQLVGAQEIYLERSAQFADKGIYRLYNHLAYWINQRFIGECRFDCFHQADTEQCLYDRLPEMLLEPDDSYNISIGDKSLKITGAEIAQQLEYFFQDVIAALTGASRAYLTRRFARILSRLPSCSPVQVLDLDSTYALVAKHIEALSQASLTTGAGIGLVTRLPAEIPLSQPQLSDNDDISHILCQGRAYPLNDKPLYLSDTADNKMTLDAVSSASAMLKPVNHQWQLQLLGDEPVFVNEQPATEGQFVGCGDLIRLGLATTKFTLIGLEQEL